MKIRSLLFSCVLVATAASCKDDRTAALDEAAEDVAATRETLSEAQEDLAQTTNRGLEERADIAHASAEMASAEIDFDQRRDLAVHELRFRHAVYETQASVARGILGDPALSEDDRQTATDRLLTFERELGEAEQAIDALATSTAAQWDAANVTVSNAYQQLEGAHEDVFEVLSADRKVLR
jgi:cellobiose-specific phosphotransferase system component IIA